MPNTDSQDWRQYNQLSVSTAPEALLIDMLVAYTNKPLYVNVSHGTSPIQICTDLQLRNEEENGIKPKVRRQGWRQGQ
jgi:hypothetical protein